MKAHKLIFVLAAGFLAGAASAQNQSVGKAYSRSFGNSYLGGLVYASASAAKTSSGTTHTARASLYGRVSARFLNKSKEIASASISASGIKTSTRATGSLRAYVRVAGKTIYSRSFTRSYRTSWTVASKPRNYKIFPSDPSFRFKVGPIPMTIRGNMGAATNANARLTVLNSLASLASIGGTVNAWGWGRASVKAGISVLYAKLELSAKFANQSLSLSTYAGNRGVRGRFYYTLQAIALKLKASARILFWKGSKTLVNWASSTYRRTLWSR